MKKQLLLIIFFCSLPAISMHNRNPRRVLFPGDSEEEEDSWDGDLGEMAVHNDNSKKTFWHIVNNGTNTKSNEEAGKGLPKPPAYIFDKPEEKPLEECFNKKNKKRNYETPHNSPTAKPTDNNKKENNDLLLSATFAICIDTTTPCTPEKSKKIKIAPEEK